MSLGVVKWFNERRGFGFIIGEENQKDYYVHYSHIKADGFRSLNQGDRVEFSIGSNERGLFAFDVQVVK